MGWLLNIHSSTLYVLHRFYENPGNDESKQWEDNNDSFRDNSIHILEEVYNDCYLVLRDPDMINILIDIENQTE